MSDEDYVPTIDADTPFTALQEMIERFVQRDLVTARQQLQEGFGDHPIFGQPWCLAKALAVVEHAQREQHTKMIYEMWLRWHDEARTDH